MSTLFLIRHGLTAQTGAVLYGRTAGIDLDDRGRAQAERLAIRLGPVRLTAIYSSPLERCVQTVEPLAVKARLSITTRPDLVEMDAGSWTNHRLAALRRRRAWRDVLRSPGTFRFPDGESFPEAQERLIAEVGRIVARHPRGRVAVATHGDMVRILLCHFSGAPLDRFQRTTIDTASVSVVEIHRGAPRILLVNDTDGGLERFAPGRGEPPWESPTARRRSGTKVRG